MRRPWWWRYQRLDGATAVDWRHGYFTRNRTDLPYPPLLRVVR